MWGVAFGCFFFLFSSNIVVGDLGTPANPQKPEAVPAGRGEAQPIRYNRGDVTHRRMVFKGGAANKEVIKHLFHRRNKKERKNKHARSNTHTLSLTHFGVLVLRSSPILTKMKKKPSILARFLAFSSSRGPLCGGMWCWWKFIPATWCPTQGAITPINPQRPHGALATAPEESGRFLKSCFGASDLLFVRKCICGFIVILSCSRVFPPLSSSVTHGVSHGGQAHDITSPDLDAHTWLRFNSVSASPNSSSLRSYVFYDILFNLMCFFFFIILWLSHRVLVTTLLFSSPFLTIQFVCFFLFKTLYPKSLFC